MQELNNVLLRLKQGDKEAYRFLFDTFYPRLYMFSLKYVKDHFIAEEVVGDTFLKLWQKRHKVHKIENIKSYLYKMVRNTSYDYLKKTDHNVRLDVKSHDSFTLTNDYIIEEEVHAILIKALESLPPKCRKVFSLSCIEKLKYKEIAEELQISVNTVKSQRARAIELLKIQLKGHLFLQVFLELL
ncbi:RNA polymerase sigma-70 factor [Flavivirga abyssicola]|uniref:RNA polymerase sigma factor n=1 Tax=Flavivirga abyssicola TaxID=3063533 RepID=UPI0026DF33A0|nr:RNA polymerase sigma-70 factor [Flavivirga sp. MEBiC07777]WVK15261.1 RNA polymerase sigma-70 factor [Flavivirga sp. MEBiC07777]